MQNSMNERIVLMVLRQGRAISTYPTVVNAARMWKKAGWHVDILTQAEPDVPDVFRRYTPFWQGNFFVQMVQLIRQVLATAPQVIIAYEPIDAELCAVLPVFYTARYIYHNIELRYPGQRFYAIHHSLEKQYYCKCETVICQDSLRMSELNKLLGSPNLNSHEYLVPNTYMRESIPDEQRYWHKRFGLSENKKILLYTGAIEHKKLPDDVISRLLEVMPEDWSLALWGWSVQGYAESIVKKHAESIVKHRLLLSLETLPEQQYLEAVASAEAGLIWYGTTLKEDSNECNIGLSSGKFWRFITLGKPVLALDKPGMGNFIREKKLGVVVERLQQLDADIFRELRSLKLEQDFFFSFSYAAIPADGIT